MLGESSSTPVPFLEQHASTAANSTEDVARVENARLVEELAAERRANALLLSNLDSLTRMFDSQAAFCQSCAESLRAMAHPTATPNVADATTSARATRAATAPAIATDFVSAWKEDQRLSALLSCYDSFLHPAGALRDEADYEHFWGEVGGAQRWFNVRSAESLRLLVSRDERRTFALKRPPVIRRPLRAEDYANQDRCDKATEQLIEHVLSRMPHLQHLSLSGRRYSLDMAALAAVEAPVFPALRSLDLSACPVTGEQLLCFVSALPQVVRVDVSACRALSWEDVTAACAAGAARQLVIVPSTEEAFEASKLQYVEESFISRYFSTSDSVGAVRFWAEIGGASGWHRTLSQESLARVLAHCTVERMSLTGNSSTRSGEQQVLAGDELREFVSRVAAQMPRLKSLEIGHCSQWPFDWPVAVAFAAKPFPVLTKACVRHSPWTEDEVVKLIREVPTLVPDDKQCAPVEVDASAGPASLDAASLHARCARKLYMWAN